MEQKMPNQIALRRATGAWFPQLETELPAGTSKLPPIAEFILRAVAWCRGRLAGSAAAERPLRLVSQLALGGKRSVSLIEVDGIRFLVGGGAETVTIIVPIPGSPSAGQPNHAVVRGADLGPASGETTCRP